MTVFVFDVDYATDKDTLKTGEVVAGTARVTILATGWVEAQRLAAQLVAATGREPTDTRLIGTKER